MEAGIGYGTFSKDSQTVAEEQSHVQGNSRNVNNEDEDEKGKKLRRYLRLYLYSAVKWRDCKCYINLIFFIVAAVQISKTGFITKQILDLGNKRAEFQELDDRGKTTLRHLLLLHWESGMEVPPYPPASGQYAIYTIDDLTKHINFAVEKYYSSENDAVGIYMFRGRNDTADSGVTFCVSYFTYDNVELGHIKDKAEIHDECFKSHPRFDGRNYTYDIVADLKNNNMNESIVFNSVLNINLTFRLFSLRLDSLTNGRCLSIQGIISFTNKDNNGQALVDLQTNTSEISCKNINVDLPDVDVRHVTETSILVSVEVFSVISLLAMFSDLLIGVWLCCKTRKYMKQNSERHFPGQTNGFPLKEYIYRIKGWNIFVIIGDIFTLIGTVNIASTNEVNWRLDEYDNYSIYLGVGCLLCWICLARYFHISKKFHLLFKTTYRAILDALAYLICVFFLFWSFVFCGYVVLGPYHIKFQSIPMAANTLFSTIIGDEITVTLDGLENDKLGSPYIKWFSQIYLYLFISIFAIVVLNILIAIFTSAYEAIQKEYKKQTKYKKQKENTDPLRKILRELLHTDDNLEDSIGQVRNALFKILEPQDNINMSPRERILRQELEAVVMDHDTSRKPTIKAFMEIGKERLNEPVKCCKVHCIS